MRLLRTSVLLVATSAFIVVCVLFWPASLGGRTTYVSTHGTSMLPRFHSGDLAIVRASSEYRVGEITAYYSSTLRTVVLHRIIAVHDGRFTFKGDSNDFVDPDHPTAGRLVGKLVARVPHGGAYRAILAEPVVLFPALAVGFGGLTLGAQRSRRKRARRRAPPPAPVNPLSHTRGLATRGIAVLATGALMASGAVLVAVTVWHAPRTETTARAEPYRQNATIGYSGPAPRGAVYPDGRIHNGDPLFRRVVKQVDVDLHYAFAAPGASRHAVRGTSEVVADVSSATGWHRRLVLAPSRAFAGDEVDTTARLDLRTIRRIERAFTNETGLGTPDVTLRVTWKVHVGGEVDAIRIAADLAPAIAFQVTPVELLPSRNSGLGSNQLAPGATITNTGSVPVPVVHSRTFNLWHVHTSSSRARLLSLVLIALILAMTALAFAITRRRPAPGSADAIVARYRYLLVNATALPSAGRRPVVAVDRMRDLARLAKLHEELIVHAAAPERHRFALFTDAVVYTHEIGSAHPAAASTDDLARWALAGLEACAAERRRAPHAPLGRHPRGVPQNHPVAR